MTPNLESIITAEHVEDVIGLELHYHEKTVAAVCPLCHKGSIRGFVDIETQGWWWNCNSCGFRGPSLQLYQRYRKLPDSRSAWFNFLAEASIELPDGQCNSELAQSNYEAYWGRLHMLELVSTGSKENLLKYLPTKVVEFLEHPGVAAWPGMSDDFFKRSIGNYVGLLTQYQNKQLTGLIDCRGLRKKVKISPKESLIFDYELVPHRTASYYFMSIRKDNVDEHRAIARSSIDRHGVREGGILGLSDIVDLTESSIIAIPSPLDFLRFQIQWSDDHGVGNPMPIVCFASTDHGFDYPTSAAWMSIPHKKIILWNYDISMEIINQARGLKHRGFIATKPVINKKSFWVKYVTPNQFVKQCRESAVHWPVALVQKMLSSDPQEMSKVINGLQPALTVNEIEQMKQVCDPADWARIDLKLKASVPLKSFTHKNKTYLERPKQGWFALGGNGSEHLISEATFTVEEVTSVDDETWMSGTVSMLGESSPYTDKESIIRKNTGKWLSDLCVNRFSTYPTTDSSYRAQLLDIALAGYRPSVKKSVTKVGWDSRKESWLFPHYFISNGQVELHDTKMSSIKTIPCINLKPITIYPRPTLVDAWLVDSPEQEMAWCYFMCVLANLLLPALNKQKVGIGMFDYNLSCDIVLNSLGEALNLTKVTHNGQDNVTAANIEKIIKAESSHDVPVIVNKSTSRYKAHWLTWLERPEPHNCFIEMDKAAVMRSMLLGQWIYVKGIEDSVVEFDFNSLEILITLVLIEAYGKLGQLKRKANIIDTVFELIKSVISSGKPDADFTVLDKARERILVSPTNQGDRLLFALFHSIVDSQLEITNNPDDKRAAVIDKGEQLYLKAKKCETALKKQKMVIQDYLILDRAFNAIDGAEETDDGWMVSKDHWNKMFKRWKTWFL